MSTEKTNELQKVSIFLNENQKNDKANETNFKVTINNKDFDYFFANNEIVNVTDLQTNEEIFEYEMFDFETLIEKAEKIEYSKFQSSDKKIYSYNPEYHQDEVEFDNDETHIFDVFHVLDKNNEIQPIYFLNKKFSHSFIKLPKDLILKLELILIQINPIEDTKFYYIHGLGSNSNSSKFLELQKHYPNIKCLDWTIDDFIPKKLNQWENEIMENSNGSNICIIASSTGSNFAIQLRMRFKPQFVHLVLINPLFNVDYLFNKSIIPEKLLPHLIKVSSLRESLIFISTNDTVIDNYTFLIDNENIRKNNHLEIDFKSTHKFENLNKYFVEIDKHVNALYL